MPTRAKRSATGAVAVEGLKLQWTIHREPQWCTADGYKGISIAVQLVEGKGRELLLEYPFKMRLSGMGDLPQRPKIDAKAIEADIRAAIAAGWNPMSRGRPFAFQANQKSK
jgi:hypothetical protein